MKIPGNSRTTYPAFWFDPEEHVDEPVFIGEFGDGSVALMTLGHVLEEAYTRRTEGAEPNWIRLYIRQAGKEGLKEGLLSTIMTIGPGPGGHPVVTFLIDGGGKYAVAL